MSKQREALEIALQALEDYQANGAPFFKCDSAVSAIREALAEPARKSLTDSEVFNLAADYYEGYGFKAAEFARAIERAHGIGEV